MQFDPERTIFLIDGSSFLYRAYYSLQPLHAPLGQPVHAVYGFIRMIKKLIDTLAMRYVAIVWDSKGKTARHTLYSAYKATRQAPPNDLFAQKELIQEFIQLIGLKEVSKEGVEADDLLFSLAHDFSKQGYTVILVSSDKDMYQVLSETIILYDAMKETFTTRESFETQKGYSVERVPLFYALVGDSSDNIPGVKGIGKVGATTLVKQFSTLDALYQKIDTLAPRIQKALENYKDDAYMSLALFTLHYHTLRITKEACFFNADQFKKGLPLYERLAFKTLIKQFTPSDQMDISTPAHSEHSRDTAYAYWQEKQLFCITEESALIALCNTIRQAGRCAVDTETDGKHPLEATLVGLSFSTDGQTAYYIPCNHISGETHLSLAQCMPYLKRILEDASIEKYMHNAKFDILVLSAQGINVQGMVFDTMIAARLALPEWQKVNLKELSKFYFSEQMLTFSQVVTEQKYADFRSVPLARATLYAAVDARQTYKLFVLLTQQLTTLNLTSYYYTIEHPLIEVLCTMEKKGMHFNRNKLTEFSNNIADSLNILEKEIMSFASVPFNLNAPRQVEQFLFTELQLPPQKKTSSGTGYSTDYEVLQALITLHPVIPLLVRHRELSKLKNTYADALPSYILQTTGNIHSSFSQTIVATGRLSSTDPNLQNIPASGIGLEIRAACIPEKGYTFISADYSQIELRVLAYLTQDPVLLDAFNTHKDIHAQTAVSIFNIPEETITHEQRQIGKRVNFSIIYGQGAYSLSKELHISYQQAKEYIERYFAQYPKVKEWMQTTISHTQERGYVTTYWGRRRYVPNINQKNSNLAHEAERVAINSIVQGTAADIVKLGMIQTGALLRRSGYNAAIILQIHDEIIVHTPVAHVAEVSAQIHSSLQQATAAWNVPIEVSLRTGTSWKEVSK